jgi:hypothetical protein
MPSIYVAGPVIRDGAEPAWALGVYKSIREASEGRGEFLFPEAERDLERAQPSEFVEHVLRRISQCDGVIGVFAPETVSGPVESRTRPCSESPC